MSTKQIRCKSAHYQVNGEDFYLPHVCLDCQKKGLVLMYNYKDQCLTAYCGPREDAKGRFIKGCNKPSYIIPMAEWKFKRIVDDPHTPNTFFCLKIL